MQKFDDIVNPLSITKFKNSAIYFQDIKDITIFAFPKLSITQASVRCRFDHDETSHCNKIIHERLSVQATWVVEHSKHSH